MKNNEIQELMIETIKNGNKIMLGTDWHMYKYNKNSSLISKRNEYDEIISIQNETIGDNDIFIFLGDLVDSEVTNRSIISNIIKDIRGKYKFIIRGNNDIFSDKFYKECGFDEITYGIKYKDVFISHTSIDISKIDYVKTNIHGHIHRDYTEINTIPYYHKCDNNINICDREFNPVSLTEILANIQYEKK